MRTFLLPEWKVLLQRGVEQYAGQRRERECGGVRQPGAGEETHAEQGGDVR